MRIAVYVNVVRGGWDAADPETWGGSEEAAVLLGDALARRGHAVTGFYDGPQRERPDGARWLPRELAAPRTHDAALHVKSPEAGGLELAPVRALWDWEERPFNPDPFRVVAVPSRYMARVYSALVPRCASRLHVVPLGWDPAELRAPVPEPRDLDLVLHTASPDRGLLHLARAWPAVLARRPTARLLLAHGWERFEQFGGPPAVRVAVEEALAATDRVEGPRRLGREELAAAYWRASVWAYWCEGGEQFGLSAVKAQLCGAVPVVRPWGALHETVWSGVRVADPADLGEAIALALDGAEDARQAHDGCPCLVRHLPGWPSVAETWDGVAARWEALLDVPMPSSSPHIFAMPGVPAFTAPRGAAAPALLQPIVQSFLAAAKTSTVWIDPSLGLPPGNVTAAADAGAAVLGWTLEDDPRPAHEVIADLGLRPGTALMCVASFGTWRAEQRRRVLSRRCLADLLGTQPEASIKAAAFGGEQGDGVWVMGCRWSGPDRLGRRDLARVRSLAAPRQTVSACLIARDSALTLPRTLATLEPWVDEVCLVDTGSTDATREVAEAWATRSGIPLRLQDGMSPRWCHDCGREHAVGQMGYGHRFAGFETPRNQSIALARGDWIVWLDADELWLSVQEVGKYLRADGGFAGYGVLQRHHSCEPPDAAKTDYPVRLFRREPEGDPGWIAVGPHGWPTYHPGLRVRFAGIVHEHPGHPPLYSEGLWPVCVLGDLHISHEGYLTERQRRGRFVRNWPLMVADRMKYPCRRLGRFLWIRDCNHQMQRLIAEGGGRLTPEAAQVAAEAYDTWVEHFLEAADPFSGDAMGFASAAAAALGRGVEARVRIEGRKPELSGDEVVAVEFSCRVPDRDALARAITARLAPFDRWEGEFL